MANFKLIVISFFIVGIAAFAVYEVLKIAPVINSGVLTNPSIDQSSISKPPAKQQNKSRQEQQGFKIVEEKDITASPAHQQSVNQPESPTPQISLGDLQRDLNEAEKLLKQLIKQIAEQKSKKETVDSAPLQLEQDKNVQKADPDVIQKAITKVICGDIAGTGFVVRNDNGEQRLLTAAHVVMNNIYDGNLKCEVYFPQLDENSGFYVQSRKTTAEILYPEASKHRYQKGGIDMAVLRLDNEEPEIPYPFCPSNTLGDDVILYGYASNMGTSPASLGSILSRFKGFVAQYAQITDVKTYPSGAFRDGNAYVPVLESTQNQSRPHPITIIILENNFDGASGGAVFDFTKDCIIGINTASGKTRDNDIFGIIVNTEYYRDIINL